MAIRFLFGGLLAGALVPPAIAQSSKASENPQDVFLSLRGTPSMGDPKASVAIVEFGDYQCPYCGEHANHTLPQIITDYIKTNKVCYFFKDFPIESLHPQAFKAAEAARCAGEQGKYWEMHDRLMQNQELLIEAELAKHASALGLDVSKFKRCVDNKTYFAQIGKDVLEGNEHHVPGTPQFYLGTLDSQESRMTVVTTIKGSQPYSAFKEALDAILGPEVQHTDPQPRVPAAELLETNVRESKDPVEHVSVPGKRR